MILQEFSFMNIDFKGDTDTEILRDRLVRFVKTLLDPVEL